MTTTQLKTQQLSAIKLAQSNLKFLALTSAQKRRQIAKDVIAMVTAKDGINVEARNCYMEIIGEHHSGLDLQDLLTATPDDCTVCAIGAMFAAHVRRLDNVTTSDDYTEPEFQMATLKDYFPARMLRSIENAFEYFEDGDDSDTDSPVKV